MIVGTEADAVSREAEPMKLSGLYGGASEVFLQFFFCVIQRAFANHASSFLVKAPAQVFDTLVEFLQFALDATLGFQQCLDFIGVGHLCWRCAHIYKCFYSAATLQ